jgi:septum formation protein
MHLILASQSSSRLSMLRAAGVTVEAKPSGVDEDMIKKEARAKKQSVEDTAMQLARAKAEKIAKQFPDALVLGADQMLECEGRWFDKAGSAEEAADQLRFLSSKTHRLVTAAVLIKGSAVVWQRTEEARLTMRDLSEDFIKAYVTGLGARALQSVGCYALEGEGAQLFTRVEGDFFVILGLPLLPLMEELRRQGLLRV